MNLKTVAREAARANYTIGEDLNEVADAVAVAVGQVWARYAQHTDDCTLIRYTSKGHVREAKPCSCGLDALIAALTGPA